MTEKVLIVGAVLLLAYGALLGYPITAIRSRGAPAVSRYLMLAHTGAPLEAAILLGLVWAVRLSTLGTGWEQAAAWAAVIGSTLIVVMNTLNWLTGVQDAFREKAKTIALAVVGALAQTIGIGIFVVGVLKAL